MPESKPSSMLSDEIEAHRKFKGTTQGNEPRPGGHIGDMVRGVEPRTLPALSSTCRHVVIQTLFDMYTPQDKAPRFWKLVFISQPR